MTEASAFSQFIRTPLFLTESSEENIRCDLCPGKCEIKSGGFGICGVRGNKSGKGIIPFYGFITALALDPIEKKPLYHFKPGSKILSLGFAGCNLRCPFCQNWHISQNTDVPGKWMQPGEIISAALREDSPSIAYTYSEPLVHAEYILDCMALARKHGIANVLVTNGCINANAAAVILKLTDAANVDLKSYSPDTYKKILGGDLQTVLDFIRLCKKMNVHTEVTTLVVPDLNDSNSELTDAAEFIASVDKDIPWHLSAYHPDYRWNAPPTDQNFLANAAKNAGKILTYVYAGNSSFNNNTVCKICGSVLIKRSGYNVDTSGLVKGECARCFSCVSCGKTAKIAV
ncbi:MAG: AmmeMemoRadiSam system radical SAM enzyme [Treponema sp.]|nr:AmmeMemoRadiSam system radical SAM enzyme [Treponema sp.]